VGTTREIPDNFAVYPSPVIRAHYVGAKSFIIDAPAAVRHVIIVLGDELYARKVRDAIIGRVCGPSVCFVRRSVSPVGRRSAFVLRNARPGKTVSSRRVHNRPRTCRRMRRGYFYDKRKALDGKRSRKPARLIN